MTQVPPAENFWPGNWQQPCNASSFLAALQSVPVWSKSAQSYAALLAAGLPVPHDATLFLPQDNAWADFEAANGAQIWIRVFFSSCMQSPTIMFANGAAAQ